MCKQATCGTCSKKTWFGCGEHVSGVMDRIPKDEWCQCEPKVDKEGKSYPPMGTLAGGIKSSLGW